MTTDLQAILDRLEALERQQAELKKRLDAIGADAPGTPPPDGNPPPSPHAREVTG